MPKISEKGLFVLSLISISLLLLTSGHAPPHVEDFGDLSGTEGEVRVACAVVGTKATEEGWSLELIDLSSNEMRGYCRKEVMPEPIRTGTPVTITGTYVNDAEPFLFVEEIVPIGEGKV